MSWTVKEVRKEKLKEPILIAGLPGIGNVGKVAVDFLIDELDAKKVYEFHSYTMPHSVFINEDNLVELPKIELYAKKHKGRDFLFLAGDVQPSDEVSCYEFVSKLLEIAKKSGCRTVIALGGIGLMEAPKEPKLYISANTKKALERYKDKELNTKIYGVVGPIVGVTGLLVGMAEGMDAIALLAETFGHPMYLGVSGSKAILRFFNRKYKFNVKVEKLDDEVKEMEAEFTKKTEELTKVGKELVKMKKKDDVNYIG